MNVDKLRQQAIEFRDWLQQGDVKHVVPPQLSRAISLIGSVARHVELNKITADDGAAMCIVLLADVGRPLADVFEVFLRDDQSDR